MAYYKDLHEYINALEAAGLLIRVKRPINKDTELHPWCVSSTADSPRRQERPFFSRTSLTVRQAIQYSGGAVRARWLFEDL